MSRCQRKITPKHREIAARLIELLEIHLGMSLREAAQKMGYANSTTLSAVKRGTALPDPIRFLTVSDFKNNEGQKVDLHWIFTGKRKPFLETEFRRTDISQTFGCLWNKLSTKKRKALVLLLK